MTAYAAWAAGHLASMITDPAKLITFPLTIAQMAFTFAESILKLVV